MEQIVRDEGYDFGLGAFETIAVEHGKPMFLEQHYERLQRAADFLQIPLNLEKVQERVRKCLEEDGMACGRRVIKITVSGSNLTAQVRENHYRDLDYQKGFVADISQVRRNETSPFTYHKTLNYGDCIFEKRKSKAYGVDEPVFLNMKGAFAEGACTNLFFVKEGRIFTPPVSCGLLPGIMRGYVCRTYPVEERLIYPEDIESFEEMFVTNSLVGIMPVHRLDHHLFPSMEQGHYLREKYKEYCQEE
ncbi:MAG: aminotransferase class IV [Blautia sp.]|jgi:4-amino-4-deoxychorismate lyase